MDCSLLLQSLEGSTVEDMSSIVCEHDALNLSRSQRAIIAHEVYVLSRKTPKPLKRSEVSKVFNVSRQLVQEAAFVDRTTPAVVKKLVVDGVLPLGKAVESIRKAARKTGVKITQKTSDSDMAAVQNCLWSILEDNELTDDRLSFYRKLRSLDIALQTMQRIVPMFIATTALRMTPEQRAKLLRCFGEISETMESFQTCAPMIRACSHYALA